MEHKVSNEARQLLADTALQSICKWKLPNGAPAPSHAQNMAFANAHVEGFFRASGVALGMISEKGKSPELDAGQSE